MHILPLRFAQLLTSAAELQAPDGQHVECCPAPFIIIQRKERRIPPLGSRRSPLTAVPLVLPLPDSTQLAVQEIENQTSFIFSSWHPPLGSRRSPLTAVPLELPLSESSQPSPVQAMTPWRSDTDWSPLMCTLLACGALCIKLVSAAETCNSDLIHAPARAS